MNNKEVVLTSESFIENKIKEIRTLILISPNNKRLLHNYDAHTWTRINLHYFTDFLIKISD